MIHRILAGHLLGDGCLTKTECGHGNSYFCIHRKAEHHEYNVWTKKQLIRAGFEVSKTYPKLRMSGGKSYPSSYFRTARGMYWSNFRSQWWQ